MNAHIAALEKLAVKVDPKHVPVISETIAYIRRLRVILREAQADYAHAANASAARQKKMAAMFLDVNLDGPPPNPARLRADAETLGIDYDVWRVEREAQAEWSGLRVRFNKEMFREHLLRELAQGPALPHQIPGCLMIPNLCRLFFYVMESEGLVVGLADGKFKLVQK